VVVRLGALLLMLAFVACSGSKKGVEDARKHPQDTAPRDPTLPPPTGDGDVQLRVEWANVPIAARAADGRTPCNTPRAPSVSPTTTWGIPDVIVMIDAPAPTKGTGSGSSATKSSGSAKAGATKAGATKAAPREARIVLDHCALSPRVVIATDKLVLASAAETPAKIAVTTLPFDAATGTGAAGEARIVYLPIAGHSVEVAVDPKVAYHVEIASADGKGRDAEDAWVLVADSPYVAITEASGAVLLRDVPEGTHTATAWLPPRAGQPAKIAQAKVTVTDGGLAEVTLDISK
jgi:hypothetical protein